MPLVEFSTRRGETFHIRPIRVGDAIELARLIADAGFDYPFLTGNLRPGMRLGAMWRAVDLVARILVAERLGALLFGARRHWFGVIAQAHDLRLRGMVMIDEVVTRHPGSRMRLGERLLLKGSAQRTGARIGDGELGIFVAPEFQHRGVAIAAVRAMIAALTEMSSPASGRILRRLWAETGEQNAPARAMIERLGLVRVPELDRPAAQSGRYARDGTPLTLVHYLQSDHDDPRAL